MIGGDRWRPVRGGIINLYEYGDQVFEFAGGRLLLRGHNTSGKTKALELLLPFCLDGDISPRKLDPFAAQREGDALEPHRLRLARAAHGLRVAGVRTHRCGERACTSTVGIGMRANRSAKDVRRWHFVLRDRRIGADLRLVRDDREPLSQADLAAAIGDDGELLDTQRNTGAASTTCCSAFLRRTATRTMLRLMRELRRPHLSKKLDPDGVAELLAAGLPDVDEALMRRLAGGLEQLDTLERDLARLRATAARLRQFHERTYRNYLRAIVRDRGERVRRSHTRFDAAADVVRGVRRSLAEAEAQTERLGDERLAIEQAIVRLEGEMQAILGSTEWSSIAEVQALAAHAAAQARAAAARAESAVEAAQTATALEAERIASAAAAADDIAAAAAGLDELGALAASAGLAARVDTLATQLREESLAVDAWVGLIRDLARDWRAVLAAHAERLERCRRAAHTAQAARDVERRAADRLALARASAAETDAQLAAAGDAFDGELAAWSTRTRELTLDPELLQTMADRARAGHDPRAVLGGPSDAIRAAIADERATDAAALAALEDELATLEERIAAVEGEREEGPAPPHLSRTSRDGRLGAPLWQLVDFASNVDSAQAAAIEAALEGSGLLDAWVTPGGALLDAGVLDVALVDGNQATGETLADVLIAQGGGVSVDVVAGLLSRVALRDRAVRDLSAVVGRDGSYGLGPLRGRAAKPAAEHIGASARAARRARVLAQLRREWEDGAERAASLRALLEQLARRAATLAHELASVPSCDALGSALRAQRIAQAQELRAAGEYEQATADARAGADAEVAADAERREHAVAHELDPAIDAGGLRARSGAAAELTGAVVGVGTAWRVAQRSAVRERGAAEQVEAAVALAGAREALARREAAEADRLAAEHAAREAALGASGAELRARHARVTAELQAARESRVGLSDAERSADRRAEGLRGELGDGERAQADAQAARDVATARFAALGTAGVLALVLPEASPRDAEQAADWPMTRVLEQARSISTEVRDASSAPGELGQEVMRRVQLLDRELADADLGAYALTSGDDLVLVRITDEAGDRGLGPVLEALSADIAERERLLSAEERRVFGDALVQEIADHLRTRIRAVHERVSSMNAVLARSPTAAGKVVQLEWRALDDDAGTQRATVDLLRKSASYHGEDERRQIVEFFRGRIALARESGIRDGGGHAGADAPAESMTDMLTRAFDYRRWFAFGLVEQLDGSRERLTARRHAVGSGGEQSVLIHLPLFAAAAALYGDSKAPRLVMLDEALSGIDDETRERVLAATVAFDLDLVMTSHELWGTYRSVPSLAVYQLHREHGVPGVHAVPFRWDGHILHELEQGGFIV